MFLFFLLYMAFLYFCYRPLRGASNLFHLASPKGPDTTMDECMESQTCCQVRFYFGFFFSLLFLWHVLSLMNRPCLPAPENHVLSFLVLLHELSQLIPELDILWLRGQLTTPSSPCQKQVVLPLQRQWVEWMPSNMEQRTFPLISYNILLPCHA